MQAAGRKLENDELTVLTRPRPRFAITERGLFFGAFQATQRLVNGVVCLGGNGPCRGPRPALACSALRAPLPGRRRGVQRNRPLQSATRRNSARRPAPPIAPDRRGRPP